MGNEGSQLTKELEPLNTAELDQGGACGVLDRDLGTTTASAAPKDLSAYLACFDSFGGSRADHLGYEELKALVAAVCDVWQVVPPGEDELARAYEKHRGPSAAGLSREGFAACADELMAGMLELHPGLAMPSIVAILAARRRAVGSSVLHAVLPTDSLPLRAMGVGGAVVLLSEVWGLPNAAGVLGREDQLVCRVAVRRRGCLLNQRAVRETGAAIGRGSAGPRGEPSWRFDEEHIFDDGALLRRRGPLEATVLIKRRQGGFQRALAVARDLPIPTAGLVEVALVDPATGTTQGRARLAAGWRSSDALVDFLARGLRAGARRGHWDEARRALRALGPETAERVASRSDRQGRTLLMIAARWEGGTALLRDLLALRSSSRLATDAHGATAAHHAALSGSLESLAALLGSGLPADTSAVGLGGATPLMIAALRGSVDHVQLLLGHGAKADRPDIGGLPAVAWALGGRGACAVLAGWLPDVDPEDTPAVQAAGQLPNFVLDADSQDWSNERQDVMSLLLKTVFASAPPMSPPAPHPSTAARALANTWLPFADVVAERVPGYVLRRLFRDELRELCGCGRRHALLLEALFWEAVRGQREAQAVRLVVELGVLRPRRGGAASAGAGRAGAVEEEEEEEGGAGLEAKVEAAVEAAIQGGLATLSRNLLGGATARVRTPGRAAQLLRLAAVRGDAELSREVLRRLPSELPSDEWLEPVVLTGEGAPLDCPVCKVPLPGNAVALCRGRPPEPTWACAHLLCYSCSQQVHGRCPLCRANFSDVQRMPDPKADPVAWFHFAGRCGRAQAPGASPVGSWLPMPDPADCTLSSPAVLPRSPSPRAAAPGGGVGGETPAPSPSPSPLGRFPGLSRGEIEDALPAAIPVEPRVLLAALDEGLWEEWDADGDGLISGEDFFEPQRGLLRWLLVHGHGAAHRARAAAVAGQPAPTAEEPPAPDNGDGGPGSGVPAWLQKAASWRPPPSPGEAAAEEDVLLIPRVDRGTALGALLRLAGVSSLDKAEVEHCRAWLDANWAQWSASSSSGAVEVGCDDASGFCDAMQQQAAVVRVRRAIAKLKAPGKEASQQADALNYLCGLGLGEGLEGGAAQAPPASSAYALPPAPQLVGRARRLLLDGGRGPAEEVLLREAFPLALQALSRHASHPQVVAAAGHTLLLLLLGTSPAVAALDPKTATWAALVEAVRGTDLAADFERRSGSACSTSDIVEAVIRTTATLGAVPRGTVDQAFLAAAAASALLLWVLDAADPEAVVPRLLRLPFEASTPVLRGFVCAASCLLLCDSTGIAARLQSWGHDASPAWAPPTTLPAAQVRVGLQVEVCCQGGWLEGKVTRTPAANPTEARDECWVVECQGDLRVYSRHIWEPGWRSEAERSLERIRLALLARAMSPPRPRRAALGAAAARRALLDGVIVRGLGPKALAPPPAPQGPTLRTAQGHPLRAGDKVWLSLPVNVARQLQTQRHGDWSDQMAFCLDCPGRAVETLSGPPRARVSHGGLGTWLWNPAAITRAEWCPQPLPFEEQHGPIVVGDEVLLCARQDRAVPLQVGHGGWSTRMAHCLGRFGRVATINNRGDVRLETPGCGAFLWNPEAIEPPGSGSVATLCAQAATRLDDEGAAVLLLLCLGELSDTEAGDAEAVEDVLSALYRAAGAAGADVPPALRAYGALALLACSVNLREALGQQATDAEPRQWSSVRVPDCTREPVLTALVTSPAMDWPAADTGDIAFRDVVLGQADAAEAAARWALAFFDSRHRRLLEPARAARAQT